MKVGKATSQDLFWHKLLYMTFSKCWMVVIIASTGKDHSKLYGFPAYIPSNNYQRVISSLRTCATTLPFNLRILRFSFLFNIFLWATSKNFSYNLSDKLAFIPHYSNKIVCLYSNTNDRDDPRFPTVRGVLRRGMTVEGLREFIVLQVGPNNETSLWICNSVAADKGIFLFHKVIVKQ